MPRMLPELSHVPKSTRTQGLGEKSGVPYGLYIGIAVKGVGSSETTMSTSIAVTSSSSPWQSLILRTLKEVESKIQRERPELLTNTFPEPIHFFPPTALSLEVIRVWIQVRCKSLRLALAPNATHLVGKPQNPDCAGLLPGRQRYYRRVFRDMCRLYLPQN